MIKPKKQFYKFNLINTQTLESRIPNPESQIPNPSSVNKGKPRVSENGSIPCIPVVALP